LLQKRDGMVPLITRDLDPEQPADGSQVHHGINGVNLLLFIEKCLHCASDGAIIDMDG